MDKFAEGTGNVELSPPAFNPKGQSETESQPSMAASQTEGMMGSGQLW